ncbi:MAG: diguanylate cyclase [Chloroflexi bacterium]|nr:diguanylate cyclase [Chloroflexota bacterium]
MTKNSWVDEFPGAITVSDRDGVILEMNAKSAQTFAADGGGKLIGTNMLLCHPEPARTKLQNLLDSPRANVYTIEKNGVKKLIYQTPWYQDGKCMGLVELALEIPFDLPHFVRQ